MKLRKDRSMEESSELLNVKKMRAERDAARKEMAMRNASASFYTPASSTEFRESRFEKPGAYAVRALANNRKDADVLSMLGDDREIVGEGVKGSDLVKMVYASIYKSGVKTSLFYAGMAGVVLTTIVTLICRSVISHPSIELSSGNAWTVVLADLASEMGNDTVKTVGVSLSFSVYFLCMVVAMATVYRAVVSDFNEKVEFSAGRHLAEVIYRVVDIVLSCATTLLLVALGLVLGVAPGIFAYYYFYLAPICCIVEGTSVTKSLHRSYLIMRGNRQSFFAIFLHNALLLFAVFISLNAFSSTSRGMVWLILSFPIWWGLSSVAVAQLYTQRRYAREYEVAMATTHSTSDKSVIDISNLASIREPVPSRFDSAELDAAVSETSVDRSLQWATASSASIDGSLSSLARAKNATSAGKFRDEHAEAIPTLVQETSKDTDSEWSLRAGAKQTSSLCELSPAERKNLFNRYSQSFAPFVRWVEGCPDTTQRGEFRRLLQHIFWKIYDEFKSLEMKSEAKDWKIDFANYGYGVGSKLTGHPDPPLKLRKEMVEALKYYLKSSANVDMEGMSRKFIKL